MVHDVNEKEGTFTLHSIERPNMNKKYDGVWQRMMLLRKIYFV